jgi:hypothetical protein
VFTVAVWPSPALTSIFKGNFMKRLLAATLFMLGTTHAALAQGQLSAESNRNVAADFAQTSAASAPAVWLGDTQQLANTPAAFAAFKDRDAAGLTLSTGLAAPTPFAAPAVASPFAPLGASARPISLAVPPQGEPYGGEGLEYRMELSLSFAIVRFRSKVYSATAPGFSTTFAYYFLNKLAIEGNITAGFAPTIFANEHIKYLGYGAGPKYVLRHARLEPWVHAILGGGHIQPQTALGGRNGLDVQVGGGVDYQLVPRVAARVGADWVRTRFFGQSQNNGQATAGIVIHF